MNVLLVISNAGVGGTQRVAMTLASWVNQNMTDTHVTVLALADSDGPKYSFSGIPLLQIASGKNKITELARIIRQQKADVVLSMGTPMCIYTVPACLITRTKHVISERNDPAHFSGRAIVKTISRMLMKTASGYVFQTRDAQQYYGLEKHRKSVVIPNPLRDADKMPAPFTGETRRKSIVNVGRLIGQKNQTMLIEAFSRISAEYPEYQLTIWGEGGDRKKLQEQIDSLGLEGRVNLPGSSNQVYQEILDAGIFVLSSDYEGMPNALMEAMALGLPCISTDCPCGGPRDLIRHE